LENVITLGGLTDEMDSARALAGRWSRFFSDLAAGAPSPRTRVYAECWFGKHVRMVGGFTFINDLLEATGCENIFGDVRQGYLELDIEEATRRHPDLMILFTEPEYPVDASTLLAERGWKLRVIESNVTRGRNIIHDGPSMMETAAWLAGQMR
jgi:ABC-type Fe3+-hydroxamate transport system substrate-binding protein